MAKSKPLKWQTVIVIDGVERIIAESDGMGNVTRHMSEEEFEPYKRKMLKNVGEGMSRYLMNHPEATLWER